MHSAPNDNEILFGCGGRNLQGKDALSEIMLAKQIPREKVRAQSIYNNIYNQTFQMFNQTARSLSEQKKEEEKTQSNHIGYGMSGQPST